MNKNARIHNRRCMYFEEIIISFSSNTRNRRNSEFINGLVLFPMLDSIQNNLTADANWVPDHCKTLFRNVKQRFA